MSELISATLQADSKWQLLASVSTVALIGLLPQSVLADDDRPTVWIEAGVQLERLTDGQMSFAPPFVTALLENPFTPPSVVQSPPRYSFGQEGRISFSPGGSDWSFTAAVRYGRANGSRNLHEQTVHAPAARIVSIPSFHTSYGGIRPYYGKHIAALDTEKFATTTFETHSAYTVLDFSAGKDVGLGVFGSHGASTFNAGIRFAQFTSQSKTRIDSDPDFVLTNKYLTSIFGLHGRFITPAASWDLFSGKMEVTRSFTGIGPSLAWNANAAVFGNPESGAVTFDWGLNAALLFGRQKMAAEHSTMAHHETLHNSHGPLSTVYPTRSHITARSRSVAVPNVGGFAGLSLRFPNARVSLGYRVDAYFDAMDGGIDTRKSYDRDFYGPFASISIGLGG